MNYEISRILLPTSEWKDYTKLFVRCKNEQMLCINGHYIHTRLYEFNTWMNLFAAKKYYKYCDLGELYLKLHIKGSYHLQIIGSNRDLLYSHVDTILVDTYITSETSEIGIPNAKNYEGVYFIVFEDKNQPIEIISAAWTTDNAPVRNNRLAIITCTYKREQFINKNIILFKHFINSNPNLKDRIKLFVVDNGSTLDLSNSDEATQIYHNINAGGAGGFTRGLMEVCYLNDGIEKNNPYTRVVFMDDDVEIIPEVFYRTLVLSDYLKEEWKESFINGAMVSLERKNIFIENIGFQNNFWVKANYQNVDLFDYYNVLLTSDYSDGVFKDKNRRVHSAWWYCSFYLEKSTKNNLPMPVFFRGDDIEWSWRNLGKHHIILNGIFVWHASFEYRVSIFAEMYYATRNMFLLNAIYTWDFKIKYEQYFKKIFFYRLKIYDYTAIELLLASMDDIIKGSAVFREDPEGQLQRIIQIAKKTQYFDADKNELERMRNSYPKAGLKSKIIYILKKIFNKTSVALEWYPSVYNFIFHKEVKIYNLLTKKYCIRSFNRKLAAVYKKDFYKKLRKIKKNYDILKKDYMDSYKELTSFVFWKEYLRLS